MRTSTLTPTPTAPERRTRQGDFTTICEALDFAAGQPTGINIYSVRGELTEALPYARLREEAVALARRMVAAGFEHGDRIGLAADSDGEFLRAFFACQYAGLTPAPLPLPAPFGGKDAYLEHLRRLLRSARAAAALAPAALAPWFREAGEELALSFAGGLEELPDRGASTLRDPDPGGLCYLQFSSGSTRFPLGVAVTQKALMANIRAIGADGLGVSSTDRAVSWLPLYHDMGLVGMLLTALAFQVSLDLASTSAFVRRPTLWLDLISSNGGTISYAPTFGYELAARRAGALADSLELSTWRIAGLGGEMIRPDALRRFTEAFSSFGFDDRAFVASYGMAEATLALTLSPLGQGLRTDVVDLERLERDQCAAPPARANARIREFALCGRPLPGHRLEVRDGAGAPVGERRVGRIFAAGPSLMQAYFDEPDQSAKVLSPEGWLDTGDLGYRVNDQIVITGRAKDLMIINGRNIWPQDLEWTAEKEIAGIRSGDVAVFSVQKGEEESVVALVQCRSSEAAAREAIRAQVANLIRMRHGLEAEVTLAPPHSLPQTSSGKLSRSRAKTLFLAGAFG
ncbi:MAG TPA: fatty acyl-AMP ligase [Caulobacteraceae bacterium]|nr:fatty acyl-AMP ligase [Caulobacteraceae bacterium]